MVNNILNRKEKLVITAIEIMDELGIQKLSTREIAKRQGVSEATLFKHFKNKSELLIAVLEQYSRFDDDIIQSIKFRKLSPKEAMIYIVAAHAEYYENYPAITAIMQSIDVLRYEPDLTEKVNSILSNQTDAIKQLIKEAQDAGEISPDADAENLTILIIGLCKEICLKWRLAGHEFSLCEKTLSTLKMVLDAFGQV